MKKIIGIGLVTAALLAGCGGASTGTSGTGADTAADTTAVAGTTTENAAGVPTSETGAGEAADTAADAPATNNATAVTAAGATAPDATAQATPEAATNTGDAPGATGSTTDNNGTAGTPNTSTTDGSTTTEGGAIVPGAYQPVDVPELGVSFQVPEGWEQVSGENAWSPAGVDVPRIGVNSADLTADWRPSSFLPEGATVKASQQATINGMQAMMYTVQNADGTAETHAIVRSGEKAYDIYARAQTLQELNTIQPVLNDIVGSVQLDGA